MGTFSENDDLRLQNESFLVETVVLFCLFKTNVLKQKYEKNRCAKSNEVEL